MAWPWQIQQTTKSPSTPQMLTLYMYLFCPLFTWVPYVFSCPISLFLSLTLLLFKVPLCLFSFLVSLYFYLFCPTKKKTTHTFHHSKPVKCPPPLIQHQSHALAKKKKSLFFFLYGVFREMPYKFCTWIPLTSCWLSFKLFFFTWHIFFNHIYKLCLLHVLYICI